MCVEFLTLCSLEILSISEMMHCLAERCVYLLSRFDDRK